jgi:hypothetical protein
MPIEYTLYLNSNCTPARLREVVRTCVGDESDVVPAGPLTFSGEGLFGAAAALDEISQQIMREDFRLDGARVRVTFRLDRSRLEHAQDSLIRCTAEVLSAWRGDAVLLFNGETVVLRRRVGTLIVWEKFGPWTPTRLLLLHSFYQIGPVITEASDHI